MNLPVDEHLKTISYVGIFLSCFSDFSEKCIHATPEHTLVYLYSGEQKIIDRDNEMTIQAGECAFIKRDHRITMYKNSLGDDLYKGISLTFNRKILKEFYNQLDKSFTSTKHPITEKNTVRIQNNAAISSLFQSLTPYFESEIKPSDEIVKLKLLEGIYALLHAQPALYPILFDFADPWKIDIFEFLNNYYMDDLTIGQIAAYTGRSLATFKRDFKKISDLTPQKWLIQKRLGVAYNLLKDEHKKVNDVYIEVGFKNPSHFATVFKQKYGVSPSELQ